ncbi:hypothetical protein H257_11197 [Aphanomyces astaci]|uniref:Uncharacterized protein n=1 Tax=Aphanomyces astaci TaxID=112090 RepID=W4G5Q4_APHAT|nr:hypothetical protein H257_11197 [Aphanomyces astaci]ETV74263.1 hypothetical protein H257_11197 [Aphanomyces astaci]|eukprot:XP_009836369.1 hypothetical protein H257_11197 [Aphanomyces astaci]
MKLAIPHSIIQPVSVPYTSLPHFAFAMGATKTSCATALAHQSHHDIATQPSAQHNWCWQRQQRQHGYGGGCGASTSMDAALAAWTFLGKRQLDRGGNGGDCGSSIGLGMVNYDATSRPSILIKAPRTTTVVRPRLELLEG